MKLMALRRAAQVLLLCYLVLTLTSCLARRRLITRGKSGPTHTLLSADKTSLLNRIAVEYQAIGSLNATVDLAPAVGSVNKGKITEYKDVRAYILFRKPAEIRIIGLYPVVRNKAFDMVSNGIEFRLYLPSKNRFVEGGNEVTAPSPNKLENLRPNVFLDALLIPPPKPKDITVLEDLTDEDNADYIIHVLNRTPSGDLILARTVWFDRLTLQIARQISFDPTGEIVSDTRYSEWQNHDGVPFPKVIDMNRPKDAYGVIITVVKIDINKPISDDKFVLEQPEGTTLQVLGAKPETGAARAQDPAGAPAPRL